MLSVRERRVVAVVVLLVLSVMLFRVGWVLTGPDLERTARAQDDCTEVLSIGPETENQITEPFEITGNSFRVSGQVTSLDDVFPLLQITPQNANGDPAGFFQTTEEGDFSENFLEGPGTFQLEINVGNTEYSLTAEDCGSTPSGGGAEQEQYQTSPEADSPEQQSGTTRDGNPPLMDAGGPEDGPVPAMPSGGCPPEYPDVKLNGCYR